jgi:hypothetical protein
MAFGGIYETDSRERMVWADLNTLERNAGASFPLCRKVLCPSDIVPIPFKLVLAIRRVARERLAPFSSIDVFQGLDRYFLYFTLGRRLTYRELAPVDVLTCLARLFPADGDSDYLNIRAGYDLVLEVPISRMEETADRLALTRFGFDHIAGRCEWGGDLVSVPVRHPTVPVVFDFQGRRCSATCSVIDKTLSGNVVRMCVEPTYPSSTVLPFDHDGVGYVMTAAEWLDWSEKHAVRSGELWDDPDDTERRYDHGDEDVDLH